MKRDYWTEAQQKAYEAALHEFATNGEVTIGINDFYKLERREITDTMMDEMFELSRSVLQPIGVGEAGEEFENLCTEFHEKWNEKAEETIADLITDYI